MPLLPLLPLLPLIPARAVRPQDSPAHAIRTVALVACARTKRDYPAPARELYASPLFRLLRDHVEQTYEHWHIPSAAHGLVDPEEVLHPYDRTLADLTPAARADWGAHVGSALLATYGGEVCFVVYAGARYRQHLVPCLRRGGATVAVPLAGLRIGQQLAWLRRALAAETAPHGDAAATAPATCA